MTLDDITAALNSRFGDGACQYVPPDAWQVDADGLRLLAISPGSWIKLMTPIMPIAEAQPFIQQMMEANFDQTQEARYAFHQDVVWAVFQYDLAALERPQFDSAVDRLLALNQDGAGVFFSRMVEAQVRQIIVASKRQGKSLEDTLKTLDRFYAEGMMGEMGDRSGYQEQALEAWRRQLSRLWPTVEVGAEEAS
ncbi:MAG: hypothetical protein WBB01_12480 [Phormidesmis sp.]